MVSKRAGSNLERSRIEPANPLVATINLKRLPGLPVEALPYSQRLPADIGQGGRPNPKELIQAAMTNIKTLQQSIRVVYVELALMIYGTDDTKGNADEGDTVISSMPIFMLEDAIESMKTIKDIGAKVEEQKKKELILMILNIVLLVIPFVGEAAGPLIGGAAFIAPIATIIGEAGNVALGIQEIIDNPLSAPFVNLGISAGGVGGLEGKVESKAFSKAAKARNAMKAPQLAKFSDKFREKDALVQKIVKTCQNPKSLALDEL